MNASVIPFAVFFGAAAAVAIVFVTFWTKIVALLTPYTEPYRLRLERADVKVGAEQLIFGIIGSAAALWGLIVVIAHPSVIVGALLLPGLIAVAFLGCGVWIDRKIKKRLERFNEQLEVVMRLMASGLRVGLGLRQAMVVVVNETAEPARSEFARVLGQTAIGVSIHDALDQLADRMPGNEMTMMTRSIRIQSQTGGNLGKVLETLAETIKQRRRIGRKVRALTSEARSSGYVITALPIVVALFILGFEPHMRDGLLFTTIGRFCLLGVAALIVGGQVTMNKLSSLDA